MSLKRIATWLRITLYVIVGAFLLIFAVNNHEAVDVSFFPLNTTLQISKSLLIIGCFTLGIFTGGFIISMQNCGIRHRLKSATRRIDALENEIKAHQTTGTLMEQTKR